MSDIILSSFYTNGAMACVVIGLQINMTLCSEMRLFLLLNCRGKCHVNKMSDVRDNLAMFLDKEDAFFYMYGYKPESR